MDDQNHDPGTGDVAGGAPAGPRRAGAAGIVLQGLVALLILGGGAWLAREVLRTAPRAPEAPLPDPRPVAVSWSTLRRGSMPWVIDGVGVLRPARTVPLASEVGGRIVEVRPGLEPGARVEAGQLLVRLDGDVLELEARAQGTAVEVADAARAVAEEDVVRLRASLALAKEAEALELAEQERWEGLVAGGRAERARLDVSRRAALAARGRTEELQRGLAAAEGAVRARGLEARLARERLDLLRARLDDLSLRAPFAGIYVGPPGADERAPSAGQVTLPGAPLGAVIDTSRLLAQLRVHVDDARLLAPGARGVAAAIDARPGLVLEGAVLAVGAEVEPRSRSVQVTVGFGAAGEEPMDVPAGAFARVELQGAPVEHAIPVQESWIAYRDGRAVMFVLEPMGGDGSTARVREVPVTLRPGSSEGLRCVVAGPADGDRVATSSLELIADGNVVSMAP